MLARAPLAAEGGAALVSTCVCVGSRKAASAWAPGLMLLVGTDVAQKPLPPGVWPGRADSGQGPDHRVPTHGPVSPNAASLTGAGPAPLSSHSKLPAKVPLMGLVGGAPKHRGPLSPQWVCGRQPTAWGLQEPYGHSQHQHVDSSANVSPDTESSAGGRPRVAAWHRGSEERGRAPSRSMGVDEESEQEMEAQLSLVTWGSSLSWTERPCTCPPWAR